MNKQHSRKRLTPMWATIIFAPLSVILLGVAIAGTLITDYYKGPISAYFETPTFKVVQADSTKKVDTEYYKTDFYKADGTYDNDAQWKAGMKISEKIASEGAVLMINKDKALPLPSKARITLLGKDSVDWVYCGGGSGGVNAKDYATSLKDALTAKGYEINQTVLDFYTTGPGSQYYRTYNSGIGEVPWEQYTNEAKNSFSQYPDCAVISLGRTDQESDDINSGNVYGTTDGMDKNYLELSKEENNLIYNIIKLKKAGIFKKVCVLLNSSCAIQLDKILANDIDALAYVGMGGTASQLAVADFLSGETNPCGRLTDTYVYSNYSAPSTVNLNDYTFANASSDYPDLISNTDDGHEKNSKYLVYQEGIYVGYRYYETRYEDCVLNRGNANGSAGCVKSKNQTWNYKQEVAFPFGFGLSYTKFGYSGMSVTPKDDGYDVSVNVTNTGSVYEGRDVVEVYVQKPYTSYDVKNKIEKASVELAGFAKTGLIEPGNSEKVTVHVPGDAFKTYDANNAKTYIVEKGDYYLSIGDGAHDALNNILALKGQNTDAGMDYNGTSGLAYKIAKAEDDFTAYAVSSYTGSSITNQFDDIDINKYSGSEGQKVTYLSRNDWQGTYPQEAYSLKATKQMHDELQYVGNGGNAKAEEGDVMPKYGANNGLSLIMMKDEKFDSSKWDLLLDEMSFDDQAEICLRGSYSTQAMKVINCPALKACDGPAGMTRFFTSSKTGNDMCYPSEALCSCTFDRELINEFGQNFGLELLHYNYTSIYAPGCNIHRAAFCGRNWEYFSEDPYLTGECLVAETSGITSRGGITITKHFALNDEEINRNGVCVWANEQAVREIFIRGFEKGCEQHTTNGIMSSYNRIGTTYTGAHKGLLTNVLRNEWGFEGYVESDAQGTQTGYMSVYSNGLVAGNDMWMGSAGHTGLAAFKENATVAQALRKATHRIVYTILHSNAMNGISPDSEIVPIMTWWQWTVIGVDIGIGLFVGLSVFIIVRSFVLEKKDKRKTIEIIEKGGEKEKGS